MASTRQPWQCTDSGILRKKEDDEEELLVFGYSCKLFRDDEKAQYIDQGKHLIPWMGDETLKIDRYDGRGALYDLKQCEPLPGGHDENWWVGLSEAERHVEQLCDEERYRALNHNEEEEALYQEEELKRLHQALGNNAYGQVAFNYDEANGKPEEKGDGEVMPPEDVEDDEEFVAPQELDIPVGMVLPETVKLNAIIEKTALFISKQGPQMEILLKMKQANNPQFQFLSYDAPLHPYYRHLLGAIKAGRYQPLTSSQPKEETQEETGDDHYLHPSLAATGSRVELAPSIPSINYKPSTDCAYSMLVNRIKDKQAAFGLIPANKQEEPPVSTISSVVGPTTPIVATTIPTLVQVPQYYMADPVISAAPVRYNLKPEKTETDLESTTDNSSITIASSTLAGCPVPINVVSRGKGSGTVKETSRRNAANILPPKKEGNSGSNSPNISTPPPDMQIIIDKMASYVAKNGKDFETIVRSKGDTRFAFLEPTHSYNSYYRHKISVYLQIENEAKEKQRSISKEEQTEASETSQGQDTGGEESQDGISLHSPTSERDDDEENNRRGKPAPVSFSIKKPKDTEHGLLEKRSALPLEESSDEEGAQDGEKTNKTENKAEKPPSQTVDVVKEPVVITAVKEEAEVIDLTDDTVAPQPEKRSGVGDKTRWAEERLKDKLAAAAREKLAAAAREKQLQAERKRRAAAFLNMIGREHPMTKSSQTPLMGPQLPDGAPVQPVQESPKNEVDSDVSTIPSPTSSEVPSPPHIGRQDPQERLSPKHNGDVRCTSSLYARIQASNPYLRKLNDGGNSASDQPSRSATDGRSSSHKRKHHYDHESMTPRSLTKGDDDGNHRHKKSKKKDHSRSRSHSRSHSSQSHSHHQPFRSSTSDWEQHRHKKKKKKKKSHHRSSSESL